MLRDRDPERLGVFSGLRVITGGRSAAPTVTVVVPAKNEARNLAHVFASIPAWVDEVVLVDGRSTDGTVAEARRLLPGIQIVTQQGRGKGDALRAGFEAAKSDIIVMIDADGSTDGGEITRFVAALLAGADYVKGSRFASGGGSDDITMTRRFGNWVLSGLVNRLFGTRYTDLCYGYNAFWARHLAVLDIDCEGFEVETVMNIRAAKARLRVHEVPSHEHSRVHGVSNLHIVKDGWRIAKVIVRERLAGRTSADLRSAGPRRDALTRTTQPLQEVGGVL
jgi:glycosyltransferase involved in cell wall biosynthesis